VSEFEPQISTAPPGVVQEELALLSEVRTKLHERPVVIGASDRDIVLEMDRLRIDLATAKNEDLGAMLQQYDTMHAVLRQLRQGRPIDEVDPDSPYFAHLRLSEKKGKRDLFLGKATRVEKGLRIVDWRNAPVSRIFYQYAEGEDYEEEIGEILLEGRVEARRTVTVERGKLHRVVSPQGTHVNEQGTWRHFMGAGPKLAGGQGTTMLAHSRSEGGERRLGAADGGRRVRRDKHLPDIAALIDPEQFSLITQPDSGLVVVRGSAGSGKTTVALHRVAWLAFNDARTFHPQRMQVVVWGRALRDYISQVLPALGVEGTPVTTWKTWSKTMVKRHFPFLPKKRSDTTPEAVSRLKLHGALLPILEDHIERVYGAPDAKQAFEDWAQIFTDIDWLEGLLKTHAPGQFDRVDLLKIQDWSRKAQSVILDWLDGDRTGHPELDIEDEAVLLRLYQLRVGPLKTLKKKPIRTSHLVVDEVQDFSPLELQILLGTAGERQCVTLSGDTQQQVMEGSGFTSWEDVFAGMGMAGTQVSSLKVGYRSTRSITSFAVKVLAHLAEDDDLMVANRDGETVELFRFTDHGACVGFLADTLKDLVRHEPNASVALITPTVEVSKIYEDGLTRARVPRVERVVDQVFTFTPGVEITEISEVKGLEFDYVVMIEATARHYPDTDHHRRLLHVGATRAAHQLWLTAVGAPSPIVRDI
jgi:DNA helicase II / ATP-dependent DNA helicase PcrA